MTAKLYIGNLSYQATERELEDLFTSVGLVKSVRLITDRDTGRAKGFGFVEMDNATLASEAIRQLNDYELGGRRIRVTEALERDRSAPQIERRNTYNNTQSY